MNADAIREMIRVGMEDPDGAGFTVEVITTGGRVFDLAVTPDPIRRGALWGEDALKDRDPTAVDLSSIIAVAIRW